MSKHKPQVVVGVDPGVRACGIAVTVDGLVVYAKALHVPRGIKGPEAVTHMIQLICDVSRPFLPDMVVVEGQVSYEVDHGAKADDLIHVGQTAGAAASHFWEEGVRLLIPEPRIWKGQIEKSVHQSRTYHKLGWGYQRKSGYATPKNVPEHLEHIKGTDWKEVGDAVGLALWGHSQL